MNETGTDPSSETAGQRARRINATVRYTMWSVFRLDRPLGSADRDHRLGG